MIYMQIRIKRKVIIYNIDLYWCPQILHVMKRLPSVDQYWSVPTRKHENIKNNAEHKIVDVQVTDDIIKWPGHESDHQIYMICITYATA